MTHRTAVCARGVGVSSCAEHVLWREGGKRVGARGLCASCNRLCEGGAVVCRGSVASAWVGVVQGALCRCALRGCSVVAVRVQPCVRSRRAKVGRFEPARA